MLVTTQCASYCRYCTRSRIVGDPRQNFDRKEHEAQLEYLRRTPQVRDVLISGGDGLTLAPKLFESILRGLREIPHIEIVRIGSRVPVFLPQRIDDELCEMLRTYHPLWINLHFNHPNEITPEVSRAVDRLTRAGLPWAISRYCLPVSTIASTSSARWSTAGRQPHPPLLPVPVRPGRGLRALPHARGQGSGDHRGATGSYQRLRGADLCHRRARRGRQDPGDAQLPHQLLGPQGGPAQLRGLHHHLRGARDVPAARSGGCSYCLAQRTEPGQSGVHGLLQGDRMWIEPGGFEEIHARGNEDAHRLQDPSKWVPYGVGAIEGQANGGARVRCRCSTRVRWVDAGRCLRPGRRATTPSGRADRVGARRAALALRYRSLGEDRRRPLDP